MVQSCRWNKSLVSNLVGSLLQNVFDIPVSSALPILRSFSKTFKTFL